MMAKTKNNKILAMALCASVMAGLHANPVFAGTIDVNTENGGMNVTINSTGDFPNEGIYIDYTDPDNLKVTGMFSVTADELAQAIRGTNAAFNDVTANTLSVADMAFTVDAKGNVMAASVGTVKYDLDTVGANLDTVADKTAGISQHKWNTTYFNGAIVSKGNITTPIYNGFQVGTDKAVTSLRAGNLYLGDDENGNSVNLTKAQLANINAVIGEDGVVNGAAGSNIGGVKFNGNGAIYTRQDDATFNFDKDNVSLANGGNSLSITDNQLTLSSGATSQLILNQQGLNYNEGAFKVAENGTVQIHGDRYITLNAETGVVNAADFETGEYSLNDIGAKLDGVDSTVTETSRNTAGIERDVRAGEPGEGTTTIEGSTSFDANGMNVGNGAVVANTDGSFSAGNGAFAVDTNGNVTANRVTVGNTVVTGSSVTTDYLQANSADIGGVLISGGLVDGVDVSALWRSI